MADTGLGCTCFRLRSLTRKVTQFYDRMLAPSGLTVTQYSLIAHVRRHAAGGPTVSELANSLFTDRTTVTRNLKPLVAGRLVQLGDGADARSKAVRITPAGERAFQAARPLWHEAQAAMAARTGQGELRKLHHMMERLLDAI